MGYIEGKWTKEEIEEYKKIRNKELEHVYTDNEIPTDKPEEIVRFLSENMHLPWITYDLIRKITAEKGKAKALQALEDISSKSFI